MRTILRVAAALLAAASALAVPSDDDDEPWPELQPIAQSVKDIAGISASASVVFVAPQTNPTAAAHGPPQHQAYFA